MTSATTASRTAVLVCQGRAVADGRIDGFADPTAWQLLDDGERAAVTRARDDAPPTGWGPRSDWELLRASAELMVPRTKVIDAAIRERAHPQVVILGAGLDGRAYRLDGLEGAHTFEVDHPASQQDKLRRAAGMSPVGRLDHVAVDFSQDGLEQALATAGHSPDVPTTWVCEGVAPYLSSSEVTETLRAVAARSAPGSRVVLNYHVPSVLAFVGRLFVSAVSLVGRRPNPMAGEPRRSAWHPDAMHEVLVGHGFTVVGDDDLLSLAGAAGQAVKNPQTLSHARIVVAEAQPIQ